MFMNNTNVRVGDDELTRLDLKTRTVGRLLPLWVGLNSTSELLVKTALVGDLKWLPETLMVFF